MPEVQEVSVQCPKELTAGFYEALASCGALPRRWHLDGRHGAIRRDPKMKDMRLLQLTPEAALVFQEFTIGKLRKSSRYLTPNVMEYLQQESVRLITSSRPPQSKDRKDYEKSSAWQLPKIEDSFTFAELFAGLGGFRLGLEAIGGQCVFASEINVRARELYMQNFQHEPHGDIRKVAFDVPNHDILVAGFPCQPFSALGPQQGLQDERGKLFEEIIRVLRLRRPGYFLLENVPGLLHSNQGRDLRIICEALEDAGYTTFVGIVNARGVTAQQRKRLYLVGFLGTKISYDFPEMPQMDLVAEDVLDFNLADGSMVHSISDQQLKQLRTQTRMSRALAWADRKLETLIAHYSISVGRGQSQLVPRLAPHNPRLFTPRECARIMGFAESYQLGEGSFSIRDRHSKALYALFGNAVCPPVIAALGASIFQQRGPHDLGRRTAMALALRAVKHVKHGA